MKRPFHTILNLVLLTIVTYISVEVFYAFVRSNLRPVNTREVSLPLPPEVKRHKKPRLADYKVVIDKDIFGTKRIEIKEVVQKPIEEKVVEELEKASLNVTLLGTIAGDAQSAAAVIKDAAKRKQGFYRVGDSVQDAVVKQILRGKVIVRVGDKDEILIMDEEGGKGTKEQNATKTKSKIQKPKKTRARRTLKRSNIKDSLKNINSLLSQVRIRPHFTGGKADGLTLSRIKPDSVFAQMGLRDGDVLKGIDGKSISRPDDILALYKKLKSGSRISLDINRRNQSKIINYSFR